MADSTDNTLKILIQLGVIGKDDVAAVKDLMKETGQSAEDMAKSMGVVNVSQSEATKILEESAKATEHEAIKKKELKEIIKKLTVDYPLLGEAARLAMDPIVLAVAGPVLAFEIFQRRVESIVEALAGVAMPDLTGGIEQAQQLEGHWKGMAEAVANANKEFNSAEGIYARTRDAIDKQADAEKKLLSVNKERALANLEGRKSGMTDGQYKISKAAIENFYAHQEAGVEQTAADRHLLAKYQERQNADSKAQAADKAANAIRLPESDDVFRAQQDALKKRADTLGKDAEKAQERMDFIGGIPNKGVIAGQADYYTFYDTYGRGQSLGGAMTIEQQNHADAVAQQKAVNAEITRREEMFKNREELRGDAAKNAGLRTQIGLELPYDRANYSFDRNMRRTLTSAEQGVNAAKTVADINGGGTHIAAAIKEVGGALNTRDAVSLALYRDMAAQINRQAEQIRSMQMGHR